MPILPIVFTTPENKDFLLNLESKLKDSRDSDILLKYPTVYIHYWLTETIHYIDKKGKPQTYNRYGVYVGESNNVVQRTKEHYDSGNNKEKWQHLLVNSNHEPQMIVIGHKHFNKSLTLDIENQLIEYMIAMKSVFRLYNGRGNPQHSYYTSDEFKTIFQSIWKVLRSKQKDLFLSESEIKDSAIFKASPFKKLTDKQIEAKDTILSTIRKAVAKSVTTPEAQLIFVQGEAGTGKTVLTTSIFYELVQLTDKENELSGLKCHLMVNHDQQLGVYEQMTERLNLGKDLISKPTTFINKHNPTDKVDVAFIDEGHLLLTQGKMSYRGSNQLLDIMERSKVTVVMFDEYQILTTEEYWEEGLLNELKNVSRRQGNYISLDKQLRMKCSTKTKQWLDDFVINGTITQYNKDDSYEIISFDSPRELQDAITKKASTQDYKLSRLVATYDWEYDATNHDKEWGVNIGDWYLPWNYELARRMTRKAKRAISSLAWAEQPHTINEVGSTFTIQGFDLSYVGVILGPSVKYRDGKIVFDSSVKKNDKVTRQRTLNDGRKQRFGEMLTRNEVKVLMSRGVNGLYIYAVDEELRKALKDIGKI